MAEVISVVELADLSGVSERWIAKLAQTGVLPPSHNGKFDRAEALRALFKHFREKSEGTKGTLAEEKLAKLKADRQLAEVKLSKERNEVADIEAVEDFLKRAAAALDMRITHELETVLPPALVGKDIVAMRQELQSGGDRIRETLRRGILNWKPEKSKP